jgi:ADP-heptose:LPS heptosyltransferase
VGDVVHTLPALNALRTAMPHAHIAWAVQRGAANLLEGHPQLDQVIVLPRRPGGKGSPPLRELLAAVRDNGRRWDAAIDFQALAKSGLVTFASGARLRIGFARAASREGNFLLMNRRVEPKSRNVIGMNLELLGPLGVAAAAAKAVLHTTAADDEAVAAWARREGVAGERFLILDPFAGWVTKKWETHKWLTVARRAQDELGVRPLVFYGPGERDAATALTGAMREHRCDPVLAPDTTLREYVALARSHGAAVVAGDTGPMHIAAALGVPAVAIFGPSDSRRNAPAFSGARFETLQDFTQPCAGTFARTCRHHDPGLCMRGVSAEEALEALARLLGRTLRTS